MEWHETESPPPSNKFDKSDPDYQEIRLFVWVKEQPEPHKGRCMRRPDRETNCWRYKWYADGFLGDFEITHWAYFPKPPA